MNVNSIASLAPKNKAYFFHVVLPLWVGGSIYMVGRDMTRLQLSKTMYVPFEKLRIPLPDWMKYNLPDGLWLYGFLMWLILIWLKEWGLQSVMWYTVLIVFAFLSEFFQNLEMIPGTYDSKDTLAYSVAIITCFYNYFNLSKK